MTEPNEILALATTAAFVVAVPTAIIAWIRILRAKTTTEYLKSIVMFALPILIVFLLADSAGLVEFPPPMPEEPVSVPQPTEIISKLSTLQIVLLVAAGATWIIGGNVLMIYHLRRTGKRWWVLLNPLRPPFGEFSSKEWSILGGLFLVTMLLSMAALSAR